MMPAGPTRYGDTWQRSSLTTTLQLQTGRIASLVILVYQRRHIVEPPDIRPEFLIYWQAYRDLQTERRTPRGAIPVNAIFEYADRVGLDRDQLKRIVWEVDKTLLEHWDGLDKAAKASQEAESERKRLGGSS